MSSFDTTRKFTSGRNPLTRIVDSQFRLPLAPPQFPLFSADHVVEFTVCSWILMIFAYIVIVCTLPLSACLCIKVSRRESERQRGQLAGCSRIRESRYISSGSANARWCPRAWYVLFSRPFHLFHLGLFFILPCIDSYKKIDLRVVSFDVPPQEVRALPPSSPNHNLLDFIKRFGDGSCGCRRLFPHIKRHNIRNECRGCLEVNEATRPDHSQEYPGNEDPGRDALRQREHLPPDAGISGTF